MLCPIGVHMNVSSCAERRFIVYSVKNIDEGIEILSGKKAGEKKAAGTYPKGTINYLVDKKLRELAEGLKRFGDKENEEKKKPRTKKKGAAKKK